jgi:hypothetical protein
MKNLLLPKETFLWGRSCTRPLACTLALLGPRFVHGVLERTSSFVRQRHPAKGHPINESKRTACEEDRTLIAICALWSRQKCVCLCHFLSLFSIPRAGGSWQAPSLWGFVSRGCHFSLSFGLSSPCDFSCSQRDSFCLFLCLFLYLCLSLCIFISTCISKSSPLFTPRSPANFPLINTHKYTHSTRFWSFYLLPVKRKIMNMQRRIPYTVSPCH